MQNPRTIEREAERLSRKSNDIIASRMDKLHDWEPADKIALRMLIDQKQLQRKRAMKASKSGGGLVTDTVRGNLRVRSTNGIFQPPKGKSYPLATDLRQTDRYGTPIGEDVRQIMAAGFKKGCVYSEEEANRVLDRSRFKDDNAARIAIKITLRAAGMMRRDEDDDKEALTYDPRDRHRLDRRRDDAEDLEDDDEESRGDCYDEESKSEDDEEALSEEEDEEAGGGRYIPTQNLNKRPYSRDSEGLENEVARHIKKGRSLLRRVHEEASRSRKRSEAKRRGARRREDD
jgi:hypothetical protein